MGVVFLVGARIALALPRAPRPARGAADAAMAVIDRAADVRGVDAGGRVAELPHRHRPRLGDRVQLVGPVPVRRLHHRQAARGGADPGRHVPGHHRRPGHRVPPVHDRRQRAVERRLRRHGRHGAVDPRGPRAVPDDQVRRRHADLAVPVPHRALAGPGAHLVRRGGADAARRRRLPRRRAAAEPALPRARPACSACWP